MSHCVLSALNETSPGLFFIDIIQNKNTENTNQEWPAVK